jgi:hypothetical protein
VSRLSSRGSRREADFFLVGAPKCGTTALYAFLAQHPDVFLPEEKELIFFGSDLSYRTRLSEDAYLRHFAPWSGERRVGTSHTAYMQSRKAAGEIHERVPEADIIVMLRDPVSMVPSWHSELLYETVEEISDLEGALDAEPARRRGERIPRSALNSYVESLFYSDVAAYSAQVARYLDTFGAARVHVILHEDLVRSPERVVADVTSCLGLPPFQPVLATHNANKKVRSRVVQRAFFATDFPGHAAVRRLLPRGLRRRLLAANAVVAPRESISPTARRRLEAMFRDDVERLAALLDRDLSHWRPRIGATVS